MGLDPAGPLGFASVRGVKRGDSLIELPQPMVMSVFGEGAAPADDDPAALPGERIWTMALGDRALHLQLHQGTVSSLLLGTSHITAPAAP